MTAPALKGSLLRAELHRFRSRRFIVVLLLLAVAVFLVVCGIASTQFEKASASTRAESERRLAQVLQDSERGRQQCLMSVPTGQDPVQFCGEPLTADQVRAEDFIDKRPFSLARDGLDLAPGVAGATAALLFVIGATWVGAEWSTRSMVALLFWEPRRFKVITTKLGVLLGVAAVVSATAQVMWLLASKLLAATRGDSTVPDGFYGDLLGTAGRGVALGVLIAALGFSIAGLVRNTGAALGVAFVYFVVVENAVRIARPHWTDLLVSTNVGALLSKGGLSYYEDGQYVDSQGALQPGKEIVLSNLHGAVVLGVVVGVLTAAGLWLFQRRDLH